MAETNRTAHTSSCMARLLPKNNLVAPISGSPDTGRGGEQPSGGDYPERKTDKQGHADSGDRVSHRPPASLQADGQEIWREIRREKRQDKR